MKERWQGLGVLRRCWGSGLVLSVFLCVFCSCLCSVFFSCFSSVVFCGSFAFGSHLAFAVVAFVVWVWIPLALAVVAFGCLGLDPTRICGGCFWLFGSGSDSHLRWLLFRVSFVDSSALPQQLHWCKDGFRERWHWPSQGLPR